MRVERAAVAALVLTLGCASVEGERDEASRALHVGFLLVDGVYNTELVAPYDVLQHADGRGGAAVRVFTVAASAEPVRTFEGLRIAPDYVMGTEPRIDILVVASAAGSRDRDLENRALVDWVRAKGRAARHVVSLCWGAFLLAEAGLLDGGPATTFPPDQDAFARRYPAVDVKKDVSFVDAGHALTSVGGVRSYELALYLVDRLFGEAVARDIAAGLVMDWEPARLHFYRADDGPTGSPRGSEGSRP